MIESNLARIDKKNWDSKRNWSRDSDTVEFIAVCEFLGGPEKSRLEL